MISYPQITRNTCTTKFLISLFYTKNYLNHFKGSEQLPIFVYIGIYLFRHYDAKIYSKQNINEYVTKMCKMDGVKGVSIAVIDGSKQYYLNYGQDKGHKINENSLFELGSTTKAFTALGILNLEKEEKLHTSDLISTYLPWFLPTYEGKSAKITIDELLCHTSGIPSWTIATIPSGDAKSPNLLIRTIQNIKSIKLNSKPGTCHEYATINYDILALIMEKITGEKYENYIRDKILIPLGMKNSFFRTSDKNTDLTVTGYMTNFLHSQVCKAPTYYGNTAAGYLVSSTSDLAKWMRLWGRKSEDTSGLVENILSHVVSETEHYYAGWNIYPDHICHGGNNPNYSSQVIISRNRELGVFSLSNLSGDSATMIADGVYRMLLGEKIKIGLWLDSNSLMDFFSLLAILIMSYFVLRFGRFKSKRIAITYICFGVICIIGIMFFPYVFHYSYQTIMVWCPYTLIIALGIGILLSIRNVIKGVYLLVQKNRNL